MIDTPLSWAGLTAGGCLEIRFWILSTSHKQGQAKLIYRLVPWWLKYLVFMKTQQPLAEDAKTCLTAREVEGGGLKQLWLIFFSILLLSQNSLGSRTKDVSQYRSGNRWPLKNETLQITGVLLAGLGCLQSIHILTLGRILGRGRWKEWNFSLRLIRSFYASFLTRSERNGVVFKYCVC